jgi:nucleoside-diphosphate-sugar epimerase
LVELTGRRPDVIHNPKLGGGLPRLVADVEVARRLLGYKPRVKLRDGLARLWEESQRMPARNRGFNP